MGPTKEIRNWLSDHPQGLIKDLYTAFEHLGIRRINQVMENLENRGELTISGGYTYCPTSYRRKARVQDKIWTAIRTFGIYRQFFDLTELQERISATPDYTRQYVDFLVNAGFLFRRGNGRYGIKTDAIMQGNTPYRKQNRKKP